MRIRVEKDDPWNEPLNLIVPGEMFKIEAMQVEAEDCGIDDAGLQVRACRVGFVTLVLEECE